MTINCPIPDPVRLCVPACRVYRDAGRPVQAALNLVLCLAVVPGNVHALLVVANHQAGRRTDRLVRALRTR